MKLLIENWRSYISEDEAVKHFKKNLSDTINELSI